MFLSSISSPDIYSNILFIIAGFSFPIHLFGGYCILFKTPEVMKSVKWSLFSFHFFSSLMDFSVSFFVQPFVCFPAMGGFSMGVLEWLNVDMGIMAFFGMTIVAFVPISIIKMFENRYFVLFAMHTCWRYIRYPFLALNYLMGILSSTASYLEIPNQEYARNVTFKVYPRVLVYDTPEHRIFILAIDFYSLIIRQSFFTVLFLIELIVFVVLIRMNINKAISGIRSSVSSKTFKMHRTFMTTLNMQVAVPIVFICIPSFISIVIPLINADNQGTNNLIYIILSTHGALSTLVMVYLQKSYRETVLQIVGCNWDVGERNIRIVMPVTS